MVRLLIRGCTIGAIAIVLAAFGVAQRADAHGGGVLLQTDQGGLALGRDNEDGSGQDFSARVFEGQLSSLFAIDAPSFISLVTPPAGFGTLPPLTNVYWDFLPMTTGGLTSNLLYWDGQGSVPNDVSFGLPPDPNVTMTLYGRNNVPASVGGDPIMVPGATLEQTLAAGSGLRLHAHRFFFLDDNDGITETQPATGIYLLALHLRMDAHGATVPAYIVFTTPGVSLTALDSAAIPWVEAHQETLVLPGDYNFDGVVSDLDRAAWRGQFGSSGPFPIGGAYADGTRNGTVDAADYVFWRDRLGSGASVGLAAATVVPEPATLTLIGLAVLGAFIRCRVAS